MESFRSDPQPVSSSPGGPTISHPRRLARIILGILLVLLAVGGFQGGISFLRDPSGAAMGAPLEWLEHAPVDDFLLPGIWLLVAFGIARLVAIFGLIKRTRWAWWVSLGIGLALAGWIVYEMLVIPVARGTEQGTILWSTFGGLGVVIRVLSLLPSVRRMGDEEPRG